MTRWHWWAVVTCVMILAAALTVRICGVLAGLEEVERDIPSEVSQARTVASGIAWWLAWRGDQQATEARQAAERQADKAREELARQAATTRFALAVESMAWRHTADRAIRMADGQLTGLRLDLAPAIDTSAALIQTGNQFFEDNYMDLSAVVAGSTVAVNSAARASDNVAQAMPQIAKAMKRTADSTAQNGENLAGITSNLKTFTEEITKPKKWWQKALGPLYTFGRVAAALL